MRVSFVTDAGRNRQVTLVYAGPTDALELQQCGFGCSDVHSGLIVASSHVLDAVHFLNGDSAGHSVNVIAVAAGG